MKNYQYETSPRKYEPEYNNKKKKQNTKKIKKPSNSKQEKKKQKIERIKFNFTVILNISVLLIVAFLLIFRNASINQSFAEIQNLKTQVSELQKENDQLEISIQNSLNLSNIELIAKETLGMQKLSTKQTIYLTLPKKDYVEPSTEKVVIEEEKGGFKEFLKFLKNIF